ncbi:hypothetical protein M3Y94_00674000 [Aphelenchoides besseyi]|nr:hypothetical protein M3Y94_00674000 [Aphelenchoides besseyi]
MSSAFLYFALMSVIWIGNVDIGDGAVACVPTVISNKETKIDGCQSHSYIIIWDKNAPMDFVFSAKITADTRQVFAEFSSTSSTFRFDIALGDRDCYFSVASTKDSNGDYVLSYGTYKAKSGEFKLHLTADGKFETDNYVELCRSVKYVTTTGVYVMEYFALAETNIEDFSAKRVIARNTDQILSITTSTTSTVQPDFDEDEILYFGFLKAYQVGVFMFAFSLAFWVSVTWFLFACLKGELYYAPDREFDHPPSDDDV